MALDLNTEDAVQLIGFYVGQKLCGADILSVREILRNPAVSPTENHPQLISGTIDLRGESIPLIDLKRRMSGTPAVSEETGEWVLVAPAGNRTAAYAVDSVTRILKLDKHDILPAPDLIVAGMRQQYIRGVVNSEFGLLIVLDLDRILSADEMKALENIMRRR